LAGRVIFLGRVVFLGHIILAASASSGKEELR
jgi:hypothetical protein